MLYIISQRPIQRSSRKSIVIIMDCNDILLNPFLLFLNQIGSNYNEKIKQFKFTSSIQKAKPTHKFAWIIENLSSINKPAESNFIYSISVDKSTFLIVIAMYPDVIT